MIWLFAFATLLVGSMAYAAYSAAPWVPTRKKDIERFFELAKLQPGESLYELGCGDARLVVRASKRFGVKGVGIELSILHAAVSWIRARLLRSGVKILFGDMFKADLTKADIVYFFLMPDANDKIKVKLEKDLHSGSRVVSYVWPISGWEPDEICKEDGKPDLYLYKR